MIESEVRVWFKEIGEVVLKGATITDNAIDDKVVGMFFSALENDLVWSFLWPVIDDIFAESTLVKSTGELDVAADKAGIDPLTIIAIVQALFSLWKQFKRK
jgi:hypothetical protein